MMPLEEGPLATAFHRDTKGVIKQEFITYVIKGSQLVKETTRNHSPEPLGSSCPKNP